MKKFFALLLSAATLCAALSVSACAEKENTVYTVYAPDGAPALALASAIAEKDDSFEYHVVASSTIAAQVTGEAPAADFCVLPVNMAASKLGDGASYKLLGTVTNGNMYFLSTGENPVLTAENLSSLEGKTVGVVQLGNVPGLTLQATLSAKGVEYAVLGNDGQAQADKVNLKGIQDAASGVTPAGGCDYYLCPEPAASAKIRGTATAAKPFFLAGSLQELYGEGGYPQAVLVAKNSVIEENKAAAEKLISYFAKSADFLKNTEAATVVSLLEGTYEAGFTPSLNAKNLTADVIAGCSVKFTPAGECKARVNAFLAELIAVNPQFTTTVADAFYYEA